MKTTLPSGKIALDETVMPKAFISYSWDDPTHKVWVRQFATRLREDGIEAILDQWNAVPGEQLPEFMERAVRDNEFVLIVCTPKYKGKYDSRVAGVGYEGDIIQGEVFIKGNHAKFIPVLRRGDWANVAPSAFLGCYYIDLRDGPSYEQNYDELLATIQGKRPGPPMVGKSDSIPKCRWTLVLDGVCDDSVKPRAEALAKHLQHLLGDSSLTVERLESGSIIIHFQGASTAFNLMRSLFASGEVRELEGYKILDVLKSENSENAASDYFRSFHRSTYTKNIASISSVEKREERSATRVTLEEREQVVSELRRFGRDLNLTDQQKEKLQTALVEAREKVADYLKEHPYTSKADIIAKVKEHRADLRQRVVNFLSPDQLTKWDAEMAKAREFLGHRIES